jgi:hypothetical protein
MTGPAAVAQLAHIGNVPVEEWLPFLVPIVALYIYGRRRERRRRREVGRIPVSSEALDETVVARIVASWQRGNYEDVTAEHLALLYPPGPDGLSVAELADRTAQQAETVQRLLEQLEHAEYLHLDFESESQVLQASLTLKGFGLVDATEDYLLSALREEARSSGAP